MEQEKELWGHTFKLVNNGLDEAEVYSFVESLIDQYGNLAKKLEHLESVANGLDARYADSSTSADRRANPSTRDHRTSRTNGLGDPSEIDKLQNLEALTGFAERTVIEAAKHARSIETEATERAQAAANRIIADALHQASTQMAWVLSQTQPGKTPSPGPPLARAVATELANPTTERPSLRLPAEALPALSHLSQDVQDLIHEMPTLDPDQAKGALESLCAKLRPLLDSLSGHPSGSHGGSETSALPENAEPADGETEPPQPLDRSEADSDESLFDGTVELALPPPVALDRMLQLHKRLKETPHVDVLNLGGSVDNGITIRILIDSPIPLLKILQELPEADQVAEELPNDNKVVPAREGDADGRLRRVVITAKA